MVSLRERVITGFTSTGRSIGWFFFRFKSGANRSLHRERIRHGYEKERRNKLFGEFVKIAILGGFQGIRSSKSSTGFLIGSRLRVVLNIRLGRSVSTLILNSSPVAKVHFLVFPWNVKFWAKFKKYSRVSLWLLFRTLCTCMKYIYI